MTHTGIKEELQKNGRIVFTNLGGSMRPLLRENRDLMIIETPQTPPRRLDAVLFERPNGRLILHRILRCYDDGYWIIGDNCRTGEYVPKTAVLGVLRGIKRGKRTVSVSDWGYRLYVYGWCAPYRLRIAVQRAYRLVRRGGSKVKRMLKRIVQSRTQTKGGTADDD